MKQFVRRTGGRIGLWGGLLAAALAAFAAGWLVPAGAPVGCKLNELTAAPDFSPFSPAAPAVATSDAGTPAAPSLPEKWVCLTFDDGPSKTTPEVLAALDVQNTVIATGGSAVYSDRAMQHLKAGGKCVYLKVAADEIERRLANFSDRGVVIADGMTLADLYATRKPLYEKYADITVSAEGGTVWDTARRIAEALRVR